MLDSQLRQWKREYLLEVEEVGELAIPPLTITLFEEGAAEDAEPQQLTTEPFQIVVTSVLPEGADLKKPKDIAPPVELAWRGLPIWAWIAIAAALVLLVLAILWWRRARRRRLLRGEPSQLAHLLALAALDRLQSDDLITLQRIEEFYVRVSGILRHYIEWCFGLRAPEQTTEEFLEAMLVAGGPIAAHRDLLCAFLEHCDLVKFARHQPATEDMHNACSGRATSWSRRRTRRPSSAPKRREPTLHEPGESLGAAGASLGAARSLLQPPPSAACRHRLFCSARSDHPPPLPHDPPARGDAAAARRRAGSLRGGLGAPQQGLEATKIYSDGIAIVMVVDISSSMATPDAVLDDEVSNRLELVKRTFRDFVRGGAGLRGRDGDLIGMVTFARYADSVCPLTLDYETLLSLLDQVDIVPQAEEDGTPPSARRLRSASSVCRAARRPAAS